MLSSLIALAAAQGVSQPAAGIAPPPPPPPAPVAPSPPRQVAGSISNDDYPADAILAEQQGSTAFTITVGPDGVPSDCRVTESSGSESLDKASCDLVTQRFRYDPARDPSGRPITSEISRRVVWKLPEGDIDFASMVPLLAFAAGELRVTLGGQPDERPRCAADAVGEAFQERVSMSCFGHQRVATAELANEPYRIVTVQRLQPEGAAPIHTAAAPTGTLIGSMSAIVEADGQGRVTQCTPVDTSVPMPGGANQLSHICDGLYFGMPLFPAADGGAKRRAVYHLEVYAIGAPQQSAT